MTQHTLSKEMATQFAPAQHEGRIRARWDESGAFHADPAPVLAGDKPPYCLLIPPPNVTAALHLGHALNNTLQDILARAHRMMGFETLWLPGTDHAGIATQAVVEKRLLAEKNLARKDMTREDFIARVQAWKDQYETRITDQLRVIGCSCDFARQRFTMDPVCARAVREAFFQLFKDGLIERGKRLVNWDPVTQTALADDEVENIEVQGRFYYLRYPLVHPPTNPDDPLDAQEVSWSELAARGYPAAEQFPDEDNAWITVATTRPETYLGDTAVAVNPHDPRAKPLRGLMVQLPIVGRIIPIVQDDYVVLADPDSADPKARYATGFLKVTPAHDPNDWELGLRHALEVINVLAPDASISDEHGWDRQARGEDGHVFVGRSREDARELVAREFEARNLLEETRPYAHSVGHADRSGAVIEPYLSDQWYVRVTDDRLRGSAQRALAADQRTTDTFAPDPGNPHDGAIRFAPARYAKSYESWHDNLRDWCISRQLWWGHQIPVWMRPGDAAPATPLGPGACVIHSETDTCVCLQHDNAQLIKSLEHEGFVRDPDVLDTWFSSALWPLSTMGWPDPAQDPKFADLLEAFKPTAVLSTGRDIITLWVSRMVMFNRYFADPAAPGAGPIPFREVFIHTMIQDGLGRKMSKSLGNGVDPLDIIETHGTDAMRFTLAHLATHTQDVRLPVEPDPKTGKNTSIKFDLGRNFSNKLWNAARFAIGILSRTPSEPDAPTDAIDPAALSLVDRWMLARLTHAIEVIEQAIARYEFALYAQTTYDLLWRDFCDWYLEAIKPTVAHSPTQRAVLRWSLETIVRLLHPITPFITELIAEQLAGIDAPPIRGMTLTPSTHAGLVCRAGWPVLDGSLIDHDAVTRFERAQGLVGSIREVRAQHQVPPKRAITLHLPEPLHDELTRQGSLDLVATLGGIDRIETVGTGAVEFVFEAHALELSNLADAVDHDAERDRLTKLIADLTRSIMALEGRLANPGYVDKAPAHLVEQTRREHASKLDEVATAKSALDRLA